MGYKIQDFDYSELEEGTTIISLGYSYQAGKTSTSTLMNKFKARLKMVTETTKELSSGEITAIIANHRLVAKVMAKRMRDAEVGYNELVDIVTNINSDECPIENLSEKLADM